MPQTRIYSLIKLALLVVLLGAAYFVARHTEIGRSITSERITEGIKATGPTTARVIYVAVYIVGTVLLLPGLLLSFVGAVLFGAWEGTLWTWVGATLGATLAFFTAKALGRGAIEGLRGGRLQALDERLRQDGFTGLLMLRLVPLFPFNFLNFGCGLTAIGTRDYVLATAIGILPGTFVYQYLFATLGRKVLDEGVSWSDFAQPEVLTALGLFAAFLIGTKLIVGRLARAKKPGASEPV